MNQIPEMGKPPVVNSGSGKSPYFAVSAETTETGELERAMGAVIEGTATAHARTSFWH